MFSLIIPFHSDYARLANSIQLLNEHGHKWNIQETLLCHNGKPLTPEQTKEVELFCGKRVRLLHISNAGIGAGYKLGIQNATQPYCILSASDLPFGFTDIESFLKRSVDGKTYETFAIGSKAHPESKMQGYGLVRSLASATFLTVRKILLGWETPGDSQGSIIIKTEPAQSLIKEVQANDYFFSLELVTRAQRRGIRVVEVPIVLENHDGSTSVSLVKDGWTMFLRIWRLSRK